MDNWMIWMALAGILVIGELLTGTFYLLVWAFALASGSAVAVLNGHVALQFFVAAMVGVIATFCLRKSRWGRKNFQQASHNPHIHMDIGQFVRVDHWQQDIKNANQAVSYTARVKYRGALWDVELCQGESAQAGLFVITEVQGNRLLVTHS